MEKASGDVYVSLPDEKRKEIEQQIMQARLASLEYQEAYRSARNVGIIWGLWIAAMLFVCVRSLKAHMAGDIAS